MLYKKKHKLSKASMMVGKTFSFMSGNSWTAAGLALAVASAYFIVKADFISAALLLFLSTACDFIDGSVARYRKEASNIGAYFDTVMDRYAEGIVAISLLSVYLPPFYLPSYLWIAAYLFGSMMTTYAKAAAKEKLGIEVTGGILERPERMMLLVIGVALAESAAIYLTYVLVLLAVFTNISALQRLYTALKTSRKKLL